MKNKLNHILAIAIAFLTTSCASYKAQTLGVLSPQTAPFSQKKEGVEVLCKAFNKQDCKRYLDRDVIAKGFQPVQISIENNTKHYLLFSKNNISVPCADPSYVASKVHTSTVGRSTAYGVGALFLWPLAIPAIVDGIKSSNANEALDSDFAGKTSCEQTIPPQGRLNGLIFVPVESYQESFTVMLINKDTQETISFALSAVRN